MDDLGVALPDTGRRLHDLDHPLVKKAQQLPEQVGAGAGDRILAIADRLWFKVKVNAYRGAATQLHPQDSIHDLVAQVEAWWWLGAAGKRAADSSSDFYSQLEAEVARAGLGSGSTDSSGLLPTEFDVKRLLAEQATLAVQVIRKTVRTLIAKSLRTGKAWEIVLQNHSVSTWARADDGDTYLAITMHGIPDPQFIATILSSVPLVAAGDWLPEPDGALGVTPTYGSLVFSTIIPTAVQCTILDEIPDEPIEATPREV
jgi:hypothetical protein